MLNPAGVAVKVPPEIPVIVAVMLVPFWHCVLELKEKDAFSAVLTVIAKVWAAEVPQELVAVTVNVPLDVGEKVVEIPVPVGTPPPVYAQV